MINFNLKGDYIMDKFTQEQIEAIDSDLDSILSQDPPIKSNEELIEKFADKMNEALKKGWPIERLVEILQAQGIDIKAQTLRSYIQRRKTKPVIEPKKGKRGRKKAVIADGEGAAAQTADTPPAHARQPKSRKGKEEAEALSNPLIPESSASDLPPFSEQVKGFPEQVEDNEPR